MVSRMLTEPERDALTRLVMAHQARIRAFLCRFESDPDAVEELVQDVFVGVLGRCEELAQRGEEDAGAYLRGVARNLVRMRWARARRGASHAEAIRQLVCRHMESDLDAEADDSVVRVSSLETCMQGLTGQARDLVDRHFFQGVPLVRLAEALNQSAAALRMTMLRIRRQLRSCVETHLKEGAAG